MLSERERTFTFLCGRNLPVLSQNVFSRLPAYDWHGVLSPILNLNRISYPFFWLSLSKSVLKCRTSFPCILLFSIFPRLYLNVCSVSLPKDLGERSRHLLRKCSDSRISLRCCCGFRGFKSLFLNKFKYVQDLTVVGYITECTHRNCITTTYRNLIFLIAFTTGTWKN